ncbi:MAG: DNA cytosine methyltransferase, partial [Planctomycetes bacterium]|nr:DNA cytosine methyltransferase [Planctomycetota bacterium]
NVKQYKDIKELTYEQIKEDTLAPIDIVTGGYPCQPFSVAGSQLGEKDKRHLWPDMFRIIKECKPTWVIGENVGGHIKLGLDTVLQDLESEGYTVRAFSISASSVGANHQRERVWTVGYSEHNGSSSTAESRIIDETGNNYTQRENKARESARAGRSEHSYAMEDSRQYGRRIESTWDTESIGSGTSEETQWTTNSNQINGSGEGASLMGEATDTDSQRLQGLGTERELREGKTKGTSSWERWWEFEPDVGRVANGIPKRVDRLKGLGNSLVPAIPYAIGQSILREEYI